MTELSGTKECGEFLN